VIGVVFDFDGVLADTEHLHLRAYQTVFAKRGWTLDERAYFERYLGYDDDDLIRLFAEDHRIALTPGDRGMVVNEKTHVYVRALEDGSILYPGAAACVRAMGARFPLAIASGSLRDEILHILTANQLLNAFKAIVSADDVAHSKPAPDPYLSAARALGIEPSRCVAIEDSHWGLHAARTAGMRTIALTTTSAREKLASADRIFERVEQVTAQVVDELFGGLAPAR
jgi:beta-phosphoglucomutase